MTKKILKEISLPHALVVYLERVDYEVKSYQSLLTFAINNNLYDSENFKKYEQEYLEKFVEYDLLKQEILNKFTPEEYRKSPWEIFYQTENLCFYEGSF